jgi:hypothetical protein
MVDDSYYEIDIHNEPQKCPFCIHQYEKWTECLLERGPCPQLYSLSSTAGEAPAWCPLRSGRVIVKRYL